MAKSSYILFLVSCCLLIGIFGCSRNKIKDMSSENPIDKVKELATQHFPISHKILYSPDSSHVAIYNMKKTKPQDIYGTVSLLIYKVNKAVILFEDVSPRVSDLNWIDQKQFQVISIPGRINRKQTGKTKHIYNVATMKKVTNRKK